VRIVIERVVGIAEIAELLDVSKQRADQLSRTQGFPKPIRYMVPWDARTKRIIRDLSPQLGGSITLEDAVKLVDSRRVELPRSPRLWRLSAVMQWATEDGRLPPSAS
jgi:hypothetical protein